MDWLINPELVAQFLGEALQTQLAHYTIAFGLAAWIHSGRMKKEIAYQVNHLTEAVNNLATALRQDLADHSDKISKAEHNLHALRERVDKLEGEK